MPASRVPACAASGPSSPPSPGRRSAGLRVQLPPENSPSLVPGAPLAGGLATSSRVFCKSRGRELSPCADTEGGSWGGRGCCSLHWRFGGKASPSPGLRPLPAEGRPGASTAPGKWSSRGQGRVTAASAPNPASLILCSPHLHPAPRAFTSRGLFFVVLLSVMPISLDPPARVRISGVSLPKKKNLPSNLVSMLKIPMRLPGSFWGNVSPSFPCSTDERDPRRPFFRDTFDFRHLAKDQISFSSATSSFQTSPSTYTKQGAE